ncbi:acyl-CoA thioesterase [Chitinolyticbacter meiyuanensis]|uniref:acyl-CoA thioesterase n=1 Tax=Chitinolyticbacter meiyuanensis TaxID=682798 RepID=UPI0011E5DE5C|nr:thioesterase family protein [Chitinolyticbacter meiyuanensis]
MPRIKLALPARSDYTLSLTVRATDLNYGGHVGNDRLLAYLQEARLGFLNEFGLSELGSDDHPGIILADATVSFLGEAFFGQALVIDVCVQERVRSQFELHYGIREIADGKPVAAAKTTCLFFDYHSRKIASAPSQVAAQWDALIAASAQEKDSPQ